MTKLEKRVNLAAVVLPFAAFLAAIVLLWNSAVSATDLAILAVMYVLTALGVTVGYHRLLTHRSFQVSKPLEYAFAILGSMAVQGPVIALGRRPPQAPRAHRRGGRSAQPARRARRRGVRCVPRPLARALGLAVLDSGTGQRAPLREGPLRGPRACGSSTAASRCSCCSVCAVPALAGWALTGTLAGAADGLLWGGLVRIFLVHHVTWSVNSVCHFLGTRRFETDDHSTNVAWLALPSFGEAWHHNHHAFPRSAEHGLRRWEDCSTPSALVITMLEKVGLARNVVRIAPERQHQRESQAGPLRAGARG